MADAERLVAVVSSSQIQFRVWCQENDLNPHDPSLFLVQRIDQVRGRWFDDVIYLGNDCTALLDAARTRLRRKVSA